MTSHPPPRPRVFLDADVLFAGAAAPTEHGASLTLLRLAELTLIEALASRQVVTEAERNLAHKLPAALPAFQVIVGRCLRVVPDPTPEQLARVAGLAHAEDLPIFAAALREGCPWLVTFNLRHYRPGHAGVKVLRPGDLLLRVRSLLAGLGS